MNEFPWQNLLIRVGIPLAIIVLYRVLVPILRARKDGTAKAWPQTSGYGEHTRATTINVAGRGDQWVGEVAYFLPGGRRVLHRLTPLPRHYRKTGQRQSKDGKDFSLLCHTTRTNHRNRTSF